MHVDEESRFSTADAPVVLEECMDTIRRKLKVLVIDDSPVSRKLVELALSQRQYSLIFATTSQGSDEALRGTLDLLWSSWTV
jgi:PleD family two-component response regulator